MSPTSPLQAIIPEQKNSGPHWLVSLAQLAEPQQPYMAFLGLPFTPVGNLSLPKGDDFYHQRANYSRNDILSTSLLLDCRSPDKLIHKVVEPEKYQDQIESWLLECDSALLGFERITRDEDCFGDLDLVWAEGLGRYLIRNFPQRASLKNCSVPCPPLRLRRMAMLPWKPGGCCRLYPNRDGALLDPVLLEDALPGAVIVAARNDWEVDASQTSLVKNEAFQEELKLALELLETTRKHLQDLLLNPSQAASMGVKTEHLSSWGPYFEA